MTHDEIIAALAAAEVPPAEALRAGMREAEAIAPAVYAASRKFCAGVYLLPNQQQLLFHGLPVLAAARHPGLFAEALALLRQPEEDLEALLAYDSPTYLARLLLSVWDGDADALFHMIEHADISSVGRWALFDTVARLTFDGRIPRERTESFLARFERDQIAGDEDSSWLAWEEAVIRLGLTGLEPALQRVWANEDDNPYIDAEVDDKGESLERLAHASANPADASDFDEARLRAIDDPLEEAAWIGMRAEKLHAWLLENEPEFADEIEVGPTPGGDAPEAGDTGPDGLTDAEGMWLDGFLSSRQVPETTMPLETLDGYLIALEIGPVKVSEGDSMPVIWDSEKQAAPVWDSAEQKTYFEALMARYRAAIAGNVLSGEPIEPLIQEHFEDDRGADWAVGFEEGMGLRIKAWDPLFKHPRGSALAMSIAALTGDNDDIIGETLTPEARAEVLDRLPDMLRSIAAFWREGPSALPGPEPARSVKTGRNEACPCGSGKKFKKCCGAAGSGMVH